MSVLRTGAVGPVTPTTLWAHFLEQAVGTPQSLQGLRTKIDRMEVVINGVKKECYHAFSANGILCVAYMNSSQHAANVGAQWVEDSFAWISGSRTLMVSDELPSPVLRWLVSQPEGPMALRLSDFFFERNIPFKQAAQLLKGSAGSSSAAAGFLRSDDSQMRRALAAQQRTKPKLKHSSGGTDGH